MQTRWGQDESCAICKEADGIYPVRMQDDAGRWRTVVICASCWPKWKAEQLTLGADGT